MGSVTIRNVAREIKRGVHPAAVKNGRSMKAENGALLERTCGTAGQDRGTWLRAIWGAEFVDHLTAITPPGFEGDSLAGEPSNVDRDPWSTDRRR